MVRVNLSVPSSLILLTFCMYDKRKLVALSLTNRFQISEKLTTPDLMIFEKFSDSWILNIDFSRMGSYMYDVHINS